MSLRFLFGPVSAHFGDQHLRSFRQSGDCLTFSHEAGCDIQLSPRMDWEALVGQLPPGWQPDFLALYLPYAHIPEWLWSAPVPLVGLAADSNLHWHAYRRCLSRCDLVLTDTAGARRLGQGGGPPVWSAHLFGAGQEFVEGPWTEQPRDIDILFVGNLDPAVQRERLPWLDRLAQLGRRHRVQIRSGVYGQEYRDLLARARIVFNRSERGECNRRVWEAVAAGALLFQEEGNAEVAEYLSDRQECVFYNGDNLEALLDHYLAHEDERQQIAAAARARIAEFSFAAFWTNIVGRIEEVREELWERARQRTQSDATALVGRTWQLLGSAGVLDDTLPVDLAAALSARPRSAYLHQALGLAVAHLGSTREALPRPVLEQALGHFRRAVAADPKQVLARLNLAEALVLVGDTAGAVGQARAALAALERPAELDPSTWESGHFPTGFDLFRVEWERAAWDHVGDPGGEVQAKCVLLRWRLHALLAELTGELAHYYEAVLARPDVPVTQAALGCALARARQLAVALPHLRAAVAGNPLDQAAARALAEALTLTDRTGEQQALVRRRRLLARALPQFVPEEPWFTPQAPRGTELASILILCCNQLDYTRQCLESVLRHTRAPYELILVNNGSTDGTAAYLEEVRHRPGPERVVVIHNEQNLGFARGTNQALAVAAGEFLILLNNDTLVLDGWCEGLVRWAAYDWPHNGMVGPVTNCSAPPQEIPVRYRTPAELAAFARQRRHEHGGQALQVERLLGFCLLVRRDVWEQIGDLDERFGLGFFEDDDWGVRARRAGFRLVVAQEVFVHHFGSRTFAGLGIDAHKQLQDNFTLFEQKWGKEYTAGYHLPEKVPAAPVPAEQADQPVVVPAADAVPARRGVSVTMITRNEEAVLGRCLESLAPLLQEGLLAEVVIADTGSTDRTREIAREHGARVVDFPWVDDFAAARNASLAQVQGAWAMWLDADEWLDEPNRERLRQVLLNLPEGNVAFLLCQRSPLEGPGHGTTCVDQVRLFRWHPDLRWQYRVHEQILPGLRGLGAEVQPTDVVIQHSGFAEPALQGAKVQRNLRLLELDVQEHPDDYFVLFNLGSVYLTEGRAAEALAYFQRSLQHAVPTDSLVPKLHALLARCYQQLGQAAAALDACRRGQEQCPGSADLLYGEAVLLRERHDLDGCAAALERILQLPRGVSFASRDEGLYGYRTRHFLAETYLLQGRQAEAEAQWRQVVREHPGFAPAWEQLARLRGEPQPHPERDQAGCPLPSAVVPPLSAPAAAPVADNTAPTQPTGRQRQRVSVCIIARNEEQNLPTCLEALRPLVADGSLFEVVVTDTGSTDRTREIARAYGAKVFDFVWVDSFAAARNACLDQASGDWILWLDCDDVLDAANCNRLRRLLAGLGDENAAYAMKCLCLPDPATGVATVVDHIRLFRNHPQIRWTFRVHEQILPAIKALGGAVRWCDVVIHHTGYQDRALRARKLERDLRLLLLEAGEQPDNPFTLFNLGAVYREQGQLPEAIRHLERSLERSQPGDSIYRKLFVLLAQSYRQHRQVDRGLRVCQEGLAQFPDDFEMLFQQGIALRELGDQVGAERSWLAVLTATPETHFASVDVGLRGYLTHHNLAGLYQEQGRWAEASRHWQAALAERPDYLPALVGLAECHLKQQHWEELAAALSKLENVPAARMETDVLRACVHLARKDYVGARRLLDGARERHREAVWPRVVYSYALLQEGKDWSAAERALRDVLALQPDHAEVRQNLIVLLRQQGRAAEALQLQQHVGTRHASVRSRFP